MKNVNFIKNKLIPFLLTSAFIISSDIMNDSYTSICNAAKRRINSKEKFDKKTNSNKKNNTNKDINKITDKKSNKEKKIMF